MSADPIIIQGNMPIDGKRKAVATWKITSTAAVAVPQGNAKSGKAQESEVKVHSPTGPGLDPTEAEVTEVVDRFDVEPGNPTVGGKPDHRYNAQQPEHNAESGCRGRGDRLRPSPHNPA